MTNESTTHSDLIHILSKLTSAKRSLERIEGARVVKQNIKYLIDDVQLILQDEVKLCGQQ